MYDRAAKDLVLMCCHCKPYSNILLQLILSADMASTVRGQIDLDLTFQSHVRTKVTSLIDILKYTCDVTRDPSSNRQLYQCKDCNGRFTTLQSYVTTCGHVGSVRRVVNNKSCETYWILLGRLMTTQVSFEVTAVPSTLTFTN